MGNHIVLVAGILDPFVLVFTGKHEKCNLRFSELADVLLDLIFEDIDFLEAVELYPLWLFQNHSKGNRSFLQGFINIVGKIIASPVIDK